MLRLKETSRSLQLGTILWHSVNNNNNDNNNSNNNNNNNNNNSNYKSYNAFQNILTYDK